MKFTDAKVYLIGETKTIDPEIVRFLSDIGCNDPHKFLDEKGHSQGETLVEIMGRLCYRSFEVGLNPNVTKIREGNDVYLANILKSGHGAVLEHASVNFIFSNVSRVFTHELVRHRAGVAISQESLRYVRPDKLTAYRPDIFDGADDQAFYESFCTIENIISNFMKRFNWESMNFNDKKQITSAIRRLAPQGMNTAIGWSANFRTLRHVIPLRTSIHAEEEIRKVFDLVAQECKLRYPNVMSDLYRDEQGQWFVKNKT